MYFQVIAIFSLVSIAQAQWKSCASFWPKITPGKQFTVKDSCRVLSGYPKVFGKADIKVTVTYTQKWSRLSSKTKLAVRPILEESLKAAIQLYEDIAKLPSDIVLILTTEVDHEVTAETFYPIEQKPPCQIKFYQRWTTESTTNKPRALQALAHELYHCVQSLGKLKNSPDPEWVREGSANYFSNLVFPDSNAEWPDKEHSGHAYKSALPIYAHVGPDAYTTSIFFQSQEKDFKRDVLHNFVMATPGGSSGLEERTRLSGLDGFTDEFFSFAKQFSMQNIQDTNGSPIPIQEIPPVAAAIKLDAKGTTGTATLTGTPFTLSVFKINVEAGQTARIFSDANDHQRMAYRESDVLEWTDMAADESVRQIDIPCNNKKTPQTFIILFISTADVKSDKGKITIATGKPIKCGARSGFVLYPLFDPKTGGGYCPKGTHSSRLAIWCCPDGTELDEAVAQQVSICCPTAKDCSKEIIPNHFRCADPSWRLWNKDNRQVGCCQQGFYPNWARYCVKDFAARDSRFVQVPQS
ncbi:hypothetical protein FSARC_10488 [Fusarium sarcochroum]|uniref:Uncharacterized protein n=1 Tax=Fusarium sarcochroum TaxID=1208366 RepID=A0A8H4TM59_9HYPO|nr:hypothetical protein FSARC_10488 [Fusarium sarcochroum]